MDSGANTIAGPITAGAAPDDRGGHRCRGWRCFDRIYCISLDQRPDRRAAARRQFQRVGLEERVEFVAFQRHDENRERGIFESHQACLARGLAAGAETIVVFEDDILFDGFDPAVLEDCVRFMQADAGWQAFFFGCLVREARPTRYPSVIAVRYRSLAHAYVVRRAFARRLVQQAWQERPFDAMLSDLLEKAFAARPAFAFQSDSPSDNTRHSRLERLRNAFGGLRRIQRANEFYQGHKRLIIAGHLLVLLAMLLFLF